MMSQIYEECKDQDGFLYCKYASYEVYGAIKNEWSEDEDSKKTSTKI